jgi:RimJ/RimL family protein N-acetyltransferase
MPLVILETPRLVVRNWEEADRALFHEINSDERVMEFFPWRRNRAQSDEMMDFIAARTRETGYGFYALQDKASGEVMGFCGLWQPDIAPILPAGTVEIGWRLAERYWGKGYVTEAAEALLRHAFVDEGLTEVVSFAVADNHRSTAVMERIGMTHDPKRDFDHPKIPDSHPHLRRHVLYAITREQFLAR